ncbi:hypothetical protein ACFY0Z_29985 [Streptomyces kronopolitis]|uniref:hypothetical protein n=1 Tax=Streptomyces kronopolitis TaxID=1612435 RepID=UPI0036A3EDD2
MRSGPVLPFGEAAGAPPLSLPEEMVVSEIARPSRDVDTVAGAIATGQALVVVLDRPDGLVHHPYL